MDPTVYVLGSVVYTCRRFSKSVPLKRMASSQNFFVWFCGVFNLPARPDTPQDKILGGIRPRRTRSCGVSDPAELSRPRRTVAELCTFYSIHLFCGVRNLTEQCPAGSDTPQNNVLRGIKPCGTTLKNEYFC
jgi:hypothetical protein